MQGRCLQFGQRVVCRSASLSRVTQLCPPIAPATHSRCLISARRFLSSSAHSAPPAAATDSTNRGMRAIDRTSHAVGEADSDSGSASVDMSGSGGYGEQGSDGTTPIIANGSHIAGRAVYLDFQATTPLDPRVLDAMLPFQTDLYGNAHSRTHHYGWESEMAVEKARKQIGSLIGADSKEIIFTSGATESTNMAIKGAAHFYSHKGKHIITTATEHKCVLDSCRALQQSGFEVTYLPVQHDGLLNMDTLKAAIRPDTILVSVMAVNNEIGVLQPISDIGRICRERGVLFHCDAAQAVGKVPINVQAANVDLLSISGHKIYGPKGVGALYVRRKPRVRLSPIMSGGGQERGFRSGTLPTPLCVGLGTACEIAEQEMETDLAHVTALSQRLYDGITSAIPHVILNGHVSSRYPGNLNLSFSYVEGESLLMALKQIAVSSGSACTSASLEPSYVLKALGVEEDMAHTSIRFGIGRFTTTEEIDYAVQLCVKHVSKLRDMSPLWEMVQEGIDLKQIQWTE